jgi:Taurine catabolism dioxygenase TauD, TfdA family
MMTVGKGAQHVMQSRSIRRSGQPTWATALSNAGEKESKPLLDFLYQDAARPEFQTRFKWDEGSIAFWDNRATWHYALNDYQGERRLMHRITIEGVPLVRTSRVVNISYHPARGFAGPPVALRRDRQKRAELCQGLARTRHRDRGRPSA